MHIILILSFLLYSPPAYAYLDPGTGNLLVYLAISAVTIVTYSLKTFIFRVATTLKIVKNYEDVPSATTVGEYGLVLFSEGKLYWSTFEPIVKELIQKKFLFQYYSMDIEDPGLTIDSPYMVSQYLGTGSTAFARIGQVKGYLMLETTPNIGSPGYPMPIPKKIQRMGHVLHGIGDIGFYAKGAFDSCDIIFTMNESMEKSIRELERLRNLPAKECVVAGVPYCDELIRKTVVKTKHSSPPVVLVAPSWGAKGCLSYYGTHFIEWLAKENYQVIVRPHPFSFVKEKNIIASVQKLLPQFPNITLDSNIDGTASLQKADLMISDKSGIRFDFAFFYKKPVLTLDFPSLDRSFYEASTLPYVWEDDMEQHIGAVFPCNKDFGEDKTAFLRLVKDALSLSPQDLEHLRNTHIKHIGFSGEAIATWAIEKCIQNHKNVEVESD